MDNKKLSLTFESKKVRRIWDEKLEKWWFSLIDIVFVLLNYDDYQSARKYWNKLLEMLKKEGNQSVTKFHRLKLLANDGKYYLTDTADVETIMRILQSIPSPKVEHFKLWLAKVGNERLQEISDPEKALNRARIHWQKMGRSEKWIQQRMMGQETRNKLTDYWKNHEVKEQNEYAILTNIIHQEWSDLTVKQHKSLKSLKTENLRDHMSDAELIFTALAELSTRQIAENMQSRGLVQNKIPARKGGQVAKNARLELEKKSGQKVVSAGNFKNPKQIHPRAKMANLDI